MSGIKDLANMGRRPFLSHMEGRKHKETSKSLECLFNETPGKSNATEAAEMKQLTLTVNNADQAKAKIYWVFHVDGNSLSVISNSAMNQLKKMF